MIEIAYPPRLELARTPTPVEPLSRWSKRVGAEIFVKRDDLTGLGVSGNKIRKLEFLLAQARAEGADTVLTCGGEQSNHGRATALAACRLGMKTRLYLRVPDPAHPPAVEANLLLDRLVGAEIEWISPAQYRERAQIMEQGARQVVRTGRRPYVIPEGGSNALGAWGYVRAFAELVAEMGDLSDTTIVYAAGSGGTGAGLILGALLHKSPVRMVGFAVCDHRDYFVNAIGNICDQAVAEYQLDIAFDRTRHVEILDGYVGAGYAKSRPEELALLRDVARQEALLLDPVYTGKAFFGLTEELRKNPRAFGPRVVFLHTGGLFGLFAKTRELAALL